MANLLGLLIGTMLLLALCAGISYVLGEIPCEAKADMMKLPHQYGLLEGCMVEVDGRWRPLESYRVID